MTTKTIQIDVLTRVEGQAAVTLVLDGEAVVDAKLKIFEAPRLFEALVRGRATAEMPDITSRICGICPVAYQMSACHAVENGLGVRVDGALRQLRRLLYCGEWTESHTLHIIMLHAPDFLGVPDVVELARHHPERVRSALRIKKAGNSLIETLGGRSVHPVNVRIGGFYRVPRRAELEALLPALRLALEEAEATLDWLSTFEFPSFDRDHELVSLRHGAEYPMNEGRITSTKGLDIDPREFEEVVSEEQVRHSTALQASLVRGSYLCGPLARFALNADQLTPRAAAAAERVRLEPTCRNQYRSLLVRAVEVIHALDEAIAIIDGYQPPAEACVPLTFRAGVGHGATEAPRGMLYHRYNFDGALVREAKIVPPTSQNQRCIEEDLVAIGPELVALPAAAAARRAERVVRNYDPCISCATHFLTLRWERVPAS